MSAGSYFNPPLMVADGAPPPPPVTYAFTLMVSANADLSNAVQLEGATLIGSRYIFVVGDPDLSNVDEIQFWLDDPSQLGPPIRIDTSEPFDLMGLPTPLDTTTLSNGQHTVTIEVITS